jgi:hypothetical protein
MAAEIISLVEIFVETADFRQASSKRFWAWSDGNAPPDGQQRSGRLSGLARAPADL